MWQLIPLRLLRLTPCICIRYPWATSPTPPSLLDVLDGFPTARIHRRVVDSHSPWMMQGLEKVRQHVVLCGLPSSEDRSARSSNSPAKSGPPRVAPNERTSISASAQLTVGFEENPRTQRCWQPTAWTDTRVEGWKVGHSQAVPIRQCEFFSRETFVRVQVSVYRGGARSAAFIRVLVFLNEELRRRTYFKV